MTKSEFNDLLRKKLKGLPEEDINKSIEYYDEMICDCIDDGMTEEEAVSNLGDVNEIVENILSNTSLHKIVKEKVKPKRSLKGWEIVLIAIGSPIWLSLGIVLLCVALVFYVVAFSLAIALFSCVLAFGATAVACLLSAFIMLFANFNFAGIIFMLGCSIMFAGLTVLTVYLSVGVTKATVKIIKKTFLGIKKALVGKGE